MMKRIFSFVMSIVMLLSTLPLQAMAADISLIETAAPVETVAVQETTVPGTTVPEEPTESVCETEAAATEDTAAPVEPEPAEAETEAPEETVVAEPVESASQEAADSIVDSGTCGDNLTWELDSEGTLTISGSGEMQESLWTYSLDIQKLVIGDGVTSISMEAFHGCRNLTTVVLPDSITEIEPWAFSNCTSLTSITIPEGVTSINDWTFVACVSLTDISLPGSVTSIGYEAFSECCSLTSITMPDSVTEIGDRAFNYCTGLTSVRIPDSVESIGERAFAYCNGLTEFTIPDSVTSIGEDLLLGCTKLESLTIPVGFTDVIGSLSGCTSLSKAVITGEGAALGDNVFQNCTGLVSVTLGEGITGIGAYAFDGCPSLSRITIPTSVTYIGEGALAWVLDGSDILIFYGGSKTDWEAVEIGANNSRISNDSQIVYNSSICVTDHEIVGACGESVGWFLEDNVLTIRGEGTIETAPWSEYSDDIQKVVIEEGVTGICERAFYQFYSLRHVILPGSLRSIGDRAFYACLALQEILLPEGLTSIGEYAFAFSDEVTEVRLPKSMTILDESAFYTCRGLKTVYISQYTTVMKSYVFLGCSALEQIIMEITDMDAWLAADRSGIEETLVYHFNGAPIEKLVIPEGVQAIGSNAFANLTELTSVTVPESVASIGSGAFKNCTNLQTVTLPSSITVIEEETFSGCTSLTEVKLPEALTVIADRAFFGCSALEQIHLPDSVTTLGEGAFSGCGLTSLTIPDSVTTIGKSCFSECRSLQTVMLSESVQSLGELAFAYCTGLKTLFIPDTVQTIQAGTPETGPFYGCAGLVLYCEAEAKPSGWGAYWDYYAPANTTPRNLYSYFSVTWEEYTFWSTLDRDAVSIAIPEGITFIPRQAFALFDQLASVTIPDTVVFIGEKAFLGCTALTSIYIPDSVETIDASTWETSPFYGCSNELHIYCSQSNVPYGWGPYWNSHAGGTDIYDIAYYDEDLTHMGVTEEVYRYWTTLDKTAASIVIPDFITMIPSRAFYGCEELKSVTIPEGVHTIETLAFCHCPNLTKVSLPSTLRRIEDSAFYVCGFSRIVLPENLRYIGAYAFFGNNNLREIAFPRMVDEICDYAFAQNNSLKKIIFGHQEDDYIDFGNLVFLTEQYVELATGYWELTDVETSVKAPWQNSYITAYEWETDRRDVTYSSHECETDGYYSSSGTVPPTCTQSGVSGEQCCTLCGTVLQASTEVPALGHAESVRPGRAATCLESGLTDEHYCTRCDRILSAQEVISPLGHTEVTDGYLAPTCTETGLTEGKHCAVCGEVLTAQTVLEALGHREVVDDYKAPTCTQTGLTEGSHCSVCGEILLAQTVLEALGHTEVVDEASAPTCTKDGLEEGRHCSVCQEVLAAQTVIPATGHTEAVWEAKAPTCTETGLTEGRYCSVCEEVLAAQEEIPAMGHSYMAEQNVLRCSRCEAQWSVTIPQEYVCLDLQRLQETVLVAEVSPADLLDSIVWTIEEGEAYIALSEEVPGKVIALQTGTAYVRASVTVEGRTVSTRCRVDVTDLSQAQGIRLGTTALTAELYSTDYTELDVLLMLPQNYPADTFASQSAETEQNGMVNNGVAIDAVRFTDGELAKLFALSVLDDRRVQIVPTDYAVKHSEEIRSKYTGTITVTAQGEDYVSEELTLTVKKTLPKLKASVATFNSFYAEQAREITVAGGTVTGIRENTAKAALPSWLTLREGCLVLTAEAPAKSTSAKVYLLVDTEEWTIPAEVILTVKNSYKAPALKLSASAVTLSGAGEASNGITLKLQPKSKKDSLGSLGVKGISVSEEDSRYFSVSELTDGSFTLKPLEGFRAGKITLLAEIEGGAKPVSLPLTVKTKAVSLKLSAKTVTLNTAAKDAALVTVTAAPGDYDLSDLMVQGCPEDLTVTVSGNTILIQADENTAKDKTHKLTVCAGGAEAALTVKTVEKTPSVTLKTKTSLDLSFPEQAALLTPAFRNYSGGFALTGELSAVDAKQNPVAGFRAEQEGNAIRVTCAETTAPGAYTLTLQLKLADGESYSASAKVTVKRTPVKLKLTPAKISLNKAVGDTAVAAVSCTTKGYVLEEPVWELMDKSGKVSAEGELTVRYADGRLHIAVNGNTDYGATYKLLVRANDTAPAATLTVTIPAESKSAVKSALKASGSIDVIRAGSAVTVTPSYKNCSAQTLREERLQILDGAGTVIADSAWEENTVLGIETDTQGRYVITRIPGAELPHTGKYTAKLTTCFAEGETVTASVKLPVKMGRGKVTAETSGTLFARDKNSRIGLTFRSGDKTLNLAETVTIKDAKYQDKLEILHYGNGEFAIGFRDGTVDSSLAGKTITLNLNVWLEGNQTQKANATVKLKLTIRK